MCIRDRLYDGVNDTMDLCEMVLAEYDDEMAKEIDKETESLEGRVEQLLSLIHI